jgi:hypothetical protein
VDDARALHVHLKNRGVSILTDPFQTQITLTLVFQDPDALVGCQIQEEHVGNGLRTQARRVLFRQIAPTYLTALASQKQQILGDFVGATGYTPTYALWLLNHSEEVLQAPTDLRRRYGPEVEQALVLASQDAQPDQHQTFDPVLAKYR